MAVLHILQQFYTYVGSLNSALDCILPSWKGEDGPSGNAAHAEIVGEILVASNAPELVADTVPTFMWLRTASQSELVNRVIEVECKQLPRTVLSLGYREVPPMSYSGKKSISMSGAPTIVSNFPNSVVTLVKGPFWEWLLSRIGDDAMFFLLHTCSLFYPLKNGCFLQISGVPVYNLMGESASVPLKEAQSHTPLFGGHLWKQRKRTSQDRELGEDEVKGSKKARRSAADDDGVTLEVAKDGEAVGGVMDGGSIGGEPPGKGPMDRCGSTEAIAAGDCGLNIPGEASNGGQSVMFRKIPKKERSPLEALLLPRTKRRKVDPLSSEVDACRMGQQQTDASKKKQRNIKKGQGTPNASTFDSRSTIMFQRSKVFYSQSTAESFTFQSPLNTPPSINKVRQLVWKVFDPKQCLVKRKGPPLPPTPAGKKRKVCRLTPRLKKAVPLFQRLLKAHKKCRKRYRHILEHFCPLPQEFRGAEFADSYKEKLTETASYQSYYSLVPLHTPHHQVTSFVRAACKAVIPSEVWGCHDNEKKFYKHISRLVCLRQFESYSLHQVMQSIKVSHCTWMRSHDRHVTEGHIPATESSKMTQMMECFVLWVVNFYIFPLIRSYFYVTESSVHHNHVFYYRKPVWRRICKLVATDLKKQMMRQLSETEVKDLLSSGSALGVSLMRQLPKSSGVRPIVNMGSRKRDKLQGSAKVRPINQELQNLFLVLTYEKGRQKKLVGSSVFGVKDIFSRWKEFVDKNRGRKEPFYFVSLDITGCYDSIVQRKLLEIVDKIICQDEYVIRRYCRVYMEEGRVRRSFEKVATIAADCAMFDEFASNLSLHSAILLDLVHYPFVSRGDLLRDLRKHVLCNIVKFEGKYYQQLQGISQGSVLSSLLCSFYYGDMERKSLPRVPPSKGILMRLIDDFLLVTTDRKLAARFLGSLTAGVPEYNCQINTRKTLKNFHILAKGRAQLDSDALSWFPWCGLLMNTKTLEVASDYTRLFSQDIADTLTVNTSCRPFLSLKRKLRMNVSLKTHPIFTDPEINSQERILQHMYQSMMVMAMKFHSYVKALRMRNRIHRYSHTLFGVVLDLVRYMFSSARKHSAHDASSGRLFPPFQLAALVGLSAFEQVLRKKLSCHFCLVREIRMEMRTGYRRLTQRNKETLSQVFGCNFQNVLRINY